MPPGTPSEPVSVCAMNGSVRATPADSSARLARAQSATFAGDATQRSATRGLVSQSVTTRSEPGNGSGRSTMLLTTVNILVVAPMPSVIVTTTATVKAGALRRVRTANRRSRRKASICLIPLLARVLKSCHQDAARSREIRTDFAAGFPAAGPSVRPWDERSRERTNRAI